MIRTGLTTLVLLGALGTAAMAQPYGPYGQQGGWYRADPYYRPAPQPRIKVGPGGYAYPDYYATSRGFMDPGFAVRGNIPGCATDLGYGRWESCDK